MQAILFLLLQLAQPDALHVDYTVRIEDPKNGEVEMEARLALPAGGTLELALPERYSFVKLAEPRLLGLQATDGKGAALPLERLGPYRWKLGPSDAETALFRWRVPQDHRSLPEVLAASDTYESPYLEEELGMLVAGTLFLHPYGQDFTSRVNFELPTGWQVLTPWKELEGGGFEPPSIHALQDEVIAVGNWETDRLSRAGFEAVVALAPEVLALRQQVVPMIMKIIASELDLFGTAPGERYLFVFGRPDSPGFGGSPKTGSMTLLVPAGAPASIVETNLGHLIAHEFHHTWLRSITELPGELRFYNEGVTDYHAYLTAARLGLAAPAYALHEFELKLAAFEFHMAATGKSLADCGGPAFFADSDAYRTVYDGGLVVGLWLDLALRNREGELRGFLRRFNGDERWSAGAQPTLASWLEATGKALSSEENAELERLIRSPDKPDLVRSFALIGVELTRSESREVGSLRANLDGTTLTDMDPQGLAAGLGLLPGDQILELNGVVPTDGNQLRAAWARPPEGRIHVRWKRAGEEMDLKSMVPLRVEFQLPEGIQGELL